MPDKRILMGVIGRPHGVRGLVRVTSYASEKAQLAAYGPLSDERGRLFVLSWRADGVAAVAELQDDGPVPLIDRRAAERLTNTRLYLERDRLPPTDEDEYYLADLVGLAAVDREGAVLGRVQTVHDYGAGASIEIERPDAASLIVPFTRSCVPDVDVAAGRVVVVPPDEVAVGSEAEADL